MVEESEARPDRGEKRVGQQQKHYGDPYTRIVETFKMLVNGLLRCL